MFGFRYDGVRVEVELSDNPGELAKISKAIADQNGKIVSVITADGSDVSKRLVTIKIIGLNKEKVRDILNSLNCEIRDLR
jgi:acetoin utilization protein AcuB